MKILSIALLLAQASAGANEDCPDPDCCPSDGGIPLPRKCLGDLPATEQVPEDKADSLSDKFQVIVAKEPNPNDKASDKAKGRPFDDRRRLLQWSPRCLSTSSLQSSKAIDDTALNNIIKDDELVYCSSQDASITKKDIPSNCFDEMYRVELSAVIGVSHFFLVGTKAEDNNENEICPQNIAMDQFNWQKKIAMIVEEDTKDLPKHRLGLASLGDILEAEEKVEAIPKEEYDYLTNGCAHYAQRIWRHLVFEETDALANFFVENVVEDSRAVEHAQKSKRGLRALASLVVGGKGGFKDYVKGIVYDQLEVVV